MVQIEPGLAQLLRPVGDVPRGQLIGFGGLVLPGDGLEILQLLLSCWVCRSAQFFQQCFHRRNIVSHLGAEAEVSPMGIAQAGRLLAPQGQDLLDQCPVVEFAFTGPPHMGAIGLLPQGSVVGVGEEGQIAGHVQSQQPRAGLRRRISIPCFTRCGGQCLQGPLRQAFHLMGLAEFQGPLLRCIEHVVAELGGESSQAFTGAVEGCLLIATEANTALLHREQLGFQDPLLGWVERFGGIALEGHQGPMKNLALAKPVAEAHNIRLLGGMGIAQLRGIADAIEV